METITFIAMIVIIIFLFIANWQQSKTINSQGEAISILQEANEMLLTSCNEMIDCLKTVGDEMSKVAQAE